MNEGSQWLDDAKRSIGLYLQTVGLATEVNVFPITDQTFQVATSLLRYVTPLDAGYWHEHLAAVRKELWEKWRENSADLKAGYEGTDVLGLFYVAAEVFRPFDESVHKRIVAFSDMRQSKIGGIDIEGSKTFDPDAVMQQLKDAGLIASLPPRVKLECYSVHAADKPREYFFDLKDLWELYMREAGVEGSLEVFTPVRFRLR